MKTPEEWCDTENKQVWLEPHFIRSVQSDARADLEAENKALRERAESAEASFKQRDLQMRAALEETESMFQRTQRAEIENVELREAKEKAEAAAAEIRMLLLDAFRCVSVGKIWTVDTKKVAHALTTNCGQPLLDRMKAMEKILESCPHEINCHEESPTCIRCQWEELKKVKP